jgi:uncharacterized Ntn-hydrolase superfamily protein
VTFSIVARDQMSGELGVAVVTAMFAVGASVPWCRPGVGAVATQAIGEVAYGVRCLDALASGDTATDALAGAVAVDPLAALRQVAVVGADGTVSAHTGELCVDHAGHVVGDTFSVQANMVVSPDVWPAMAEAFTGSTGALARRLHLALEAGAAAGGDARGASSGAIVVVSGARASTPGAGVIVDVRVDRDPDPLGALKDLLDAADASSGFGRAVDQLMNGDAADALRTIDAALASLPGDENLRFLRASALMGNGAHDAASAELRALVAARPTWAVALRGFAARGLLVLPPGVSLDAILGEDGSRNDA